MKNNVLFIPHPGAQQNFLTNDADEVLFASCVGAGKSLCLLIDASKYVEKYPSFNALLLRRSYPELEKSLIKVSKTLYDKSLSYLGGSYNQSQHLWTFANGARIQFASLDHPDDINKYRGVDWSYLGFDELTTFEWEQVLTLKAWLRSSKGVPLRFRATSNAGGVSHQDVFDYWKLWLNPHHPNRLKSNMIVKYPNGKTKSCVMAYPEDNPSIDYKEYAKQFDGMSSHVVKQLLYNDWTAIPAKAEYFKRDLITPVNSSNDVIRRVRSYDLAGSEAKTADYTASILLGYTKDNRIIIEDVYRARLNTNKVEQLILDNAKKDGRGVKIVLPLEPAAAGKAWADKLSKMLHGYHFTFVPQNRASGGKVTRAMPVSAQALKGNISIIPNKYTKEFFDELEAFTDDDKLYSNDDMVDALSQGYNELARKSAGFSKLKFEQPTRAFGSTTKWNS